jgi:hypothetical protein
LDPGTEISKMNTSHDKLFRRKFVVPETEQQTYYGEATYSANT